MASTGSTTLNVSRRGSHVSDYGKNFSVELVIDYSFSQYKIKITTIKLYFKCSSNPGVTKNSQQDTHDTDSHSITIKVAGVSYDTTISDFSMQDIWSNYSSHKKNVATWTIGKEFDKTSGSIKPSISLTYDTETGGMGEIYYPGSGQSSTITITDSNTYEYLVSYKAQAGSYIDLNGTTHSKVISLGRDLPAQGGTTQHKVTNNNQYYWSSKSETFYIYLKGKDPENSNNTFDIDTYTDDRKTTPQFARWEAYNYDNTLIATYYDNPLGTKTLNQNTVLWIIPQAAANNDIKWVKKGTYTLPSTQSIEPKTINEDFYKITFKNADLPMPQITNLPEPLQSHKIQSYTFDGWYDSNDTKKSGTIDYSKTTTDSWTYTAKWIPDSTKYEQITLPFLSTDDYTFLGWIEESNNSGNEQGNGSLDPEGKAQYYQGGQSFTPTKSMTLVPIWSKNAWVNISQIVVGAPEEITTTENVNFNINKLDINILKQLPAEIKPHAFYLLKTFSVCENLDNPMPTGLYRYNGTVANLFNNSTSCYVLHFSMGYGNSSGRAQILIPYNASALLNNIYIRIYLTNDNAPLWTPWKTINLT